MSKKQPSQQKIAIVGPPGAGKSTLAAGLFYNLKVMGMKVEWIPELIKTKVYEGVDFSKDGFDIANTLKQQSFEEIFEKARHKIDFLVIEAPLCNGYFYSSFYKKKDEAVILKKIAEKKINTYDIIFFMERLDSEKYVQFGRKESREESEQLQKHIKKELKNIDYKGKVVSVNLKTPISEVLKHLNLEE